MYKCISDSNQSSVQEEDILTPQSWSVKVTLNSPNCVYDLSVIGTTQNLQLSLPYQGHFKYSADFKGIVLKLQQNLEEFDSNFQHFRKHHKYFATKSATYFTAIF